MRERWTMRRNYMACVCVVPPDCLYGCALSQCLPATLASIPGDASVR